MGFPGRIVRGPMAADVLQRQFTQIFNGLFRDRRLSFKAKGIFGLISTHRDGYGVSEEAIAAFSTDGLSAVRSGLKELIEHGYLVRDRQRDDLGRLGESVYYITDMPDGLMIILDPDWDGVGEAPEAQPRNRRSDPTCENRALGGDERNRRSDPTCDFPKLENPRLENRPSKNTSTQKTSGKNTKSVRPDGDAGAREVVPGGAGMDGGMDAGGVVEVQEERPGAAGGVGAAAAGAAPQAAAAEGVPPQREAVPVAQTPGVELLLSIGASRPELLLTGAALRDQGAVVTELLARGWRREVLREVITGRPLPVPLTKSVGAVIAARLREAAAMPVPRLIGGPAAGAAGADGDVEPSSTAAADRTAEDALRGVPVMAECEGRDGTCGRPLAAGRDRCPECLGWPECTADGCTRRVQGGGLCPQCWDAALSAPEPTEDGTCPGHDGTGCGRAAVSGGLCARCKVAAAEALARAIEAAKAAVAAEEEATATP